MRSAPSIAERPPHDRVGVDLSAAPAIELREVSRRFDGTMALRDVSLDVPSGSILGLIGPSGSGKTTAVRLLTGILAPTSGEVRVLGEEPRRFRRATREKIGYVPQGFLLYPELTAAENVDFMASLFGLQFRRRRKRVREVLQLLDLWTVRGRQASALSGGMQRRLELACAFVHEPAVLFLDEPTVGLDPLLRRSIWQELHRLRQDGRTLLVTTQYVGEAEECDRVALLTEGRLIAFETPEGLRRKAQGGDVVEIETDAPVDAERIVEHPVLLVDAAVVRLSQQGPRSLLAVSRDGATVTPALVEAIESSGAHVVGMRQHRPSFDDVFTMLVEREREGDVAQAEQETEAASGQTGASQAGDAAPGLPKEAGRR
jgi:ABC-2 type transport system ATP-binding protein